LILRLGLELDEEARKLRVEVEALRARRNEIAGKIAKDNAKARTRPRTLPRGPGGRRYLQA
jgi:seryl-tRNA synthetase